MNTALNAHCVVLSMATDASAYDLACAFAAPLEMLPGFTPAQNVILDELWHKLEDCPDLRDYLSTGYDWRTIVGMFRTVCVEETEESCERLFHLEREVQHAVCMYKDLKELVAQATIYVVAHRDDWAIAHNRRREKCIDYITNSASHDELRALILMLDPSFNICGFTKNDCVSYIILSLGSVID